MSEQPTSYRPRCMNLTCKSMMVFGENFENDPDYQAGMVDFTCLLTSRGHGPDEDEVSLERCSDPERSCFQEY